MTWFSNACLVRKMTRCDLSQNGYGTKNGDFCQKLHFPDDMVIFRKKFRAHSRRNQICLCYHLHRRQRQDDNSLMRRTLSHHCSTISPETSIATKK